MSLIKAFTVEHARVVCLPLNDVDTDQIVPKRFLTRIARTGWKDYLFYDWRFDGAGRPVASFPLNDVWANKASVLVVGRNFGCGSSREHAVWALQEFGFRVIVGESFADIFENNALRLGMVLIRLERSQLAALTADMRTGDEVVVNLEAQVIHAGTRTFNFDIDPFYRGCLMRGVDEIGLTLEDADAITRYEASRPLRGDTRELFSVEAVR